MTKQAARRPEATAPMPWLLIILVVVTTGMAVAARTETERLIVLTIAEGMVVTYFCIALRACMKAPHAKAPVGIIEGERGRTGS